MKLVYVVFVIFIVSCGQNSSPEGRLNLRIEQLERRIDTVQEQNRAIQDSLTIMKEALLNKR